MHIVILILAWITPAVIAGALGWSGIWGSGSAMVEYLVPLPVAGGVFHVPTFVIAAAIILGARKTASPVARYLPILAFGILVAALSLMLEFDRLNAWLFTDYAPSGSPLRLDGNPFMLFVATDAFWVGVYTLVRAGSPPARLWLALPVIPAVIVIASAVSYQSGGPVFKMGGSTYTSVRGQQIVAVYTSASYDEKLLLDWIEEDRFFMFPWFDVNSEHTAVHFTNSMQIIKWGRMDQLDHETTVATVCLYEEDRSIVPHPGYYDCFTGRRTVEQEVAVLAASESTGLGTDIDFWYARVLMCDDVEIPEAAATDIARVGVCQGIHRGFAQDLQRFVQKYGQESEQVSFVRAQAAARELGAI